MNSDREPWFRSLRRSKTFVAFVMIGGGVFPALLLFPLWDSDWAAVVAGILFWPCAALAGLLTYTWAASSHDSPEAAS